MICFSCLLYTSSIKYYPNPHLKWEKTSTYNIELEYSLFNNKLVGNFSYYYRHTTDAFMSKTVSRINGVSTYTVNRGTLNNQGFEFNFNFTPIENLGADVYKRQHSNRPTSYTFYDKVSPEQRNVTTSLSISSNLPKLHEH